MNPILLGLIIIAVVYVIGTIAERWAWSKAIAVIGFFILILESLYSAFR